MSTRLSEDQSQLAEVEFVVRIQGQEVRHRDASSPSHEWGEQDGLAGSQAQDDPLLVSAFHQQWTAEILIGIVCLPKKIRTMNNRFLQSVQVRTLQNAKHDMKCFPPLIFF